MIVSKFSDDIDSRMAAYNQVVMTDLLPKWCANFGDNLPITKRAKDLDQAPMLCIKDETEDLIVLKRPHCIVIGAGPSLEKVDLSALKAYKGDIIVCNKSFEPVLKAGLIPDWVCLLDADAISVTQFRFLEDVRQVNTRTKFFVASTVYPQSLAIIEAAAYPGNLYCFNPTVRMDEQTDINRSWEWMNGKTSFIHGGNVGGLALNLAMELGYERIGLLGFDFFEKRNRNWTFKESMEREVMWYPDTDEYIHVPFNFMCYAQWMFIKAENYRSEAREVVNLSDSPMMRHTPTLAQEDLHEFIAKM